MPLPTGSPEQISSYFAMLASTAATETGLVSVLDGVSQTVPGALETDSPEQISSYFAILASMAATETGLVSALDSVSQILGTAGTGSGPRETGSPEHISSYFAALTSAAATNTQLLTTLGSASPIQGTGENSSSTIGSTSLIIIPTTSAVSSNTVPTNPVAATGAASYFGVTCSGLWLLTLSCFLSLVLG